MKEIVYIDMERKKDIEKRLAEEYKYPEPVSLEVKLEYSGFDPFVFPDRKAEPVVKRRTREQIRALLEDINAV